MTPLIIGIAAFAASGLTLFSGFGLGTLLLPVFALFFPIDLAVGLTAIVHLLNNLFKLSLVGRYADKGVVLKFGIPAVIAAWFGAQILSRLSRLPALFDYALGANEFSVTPVKAAMGGLIFFFALMEILPAFRKLKFDPKFLPLGGILSGFFGGISGHQGAFRTAFLIRAGLSRESFIGTGIVIACFVDFSRLAVYAGHFPKAGIQENAAPVFTAVGCAFLGAWTANRFRNKMTLEKIQFLVSGLLFLIAAGLAAGVI